MTALLILASFGWLAGAPAAAPAYAEGQVWEYRTRPQDEGSHAKIQLIEKIGNGETVFHVSLVGVRLGEDAAGQIQHLPVSRETLDASLTRLSDRAIHFPVIAQGHAQWREAKGGVFTIPLAEIATIAENALSGAPRE